MADNKEIINLYTELAENPNKDFGWDTGLENAKAHAYKEEWIDSITSKVWDYCAAVGNPFKSADIHQGDTVLDLGCGAGIDVLVASLLVGEKGKVYGVDITPKMVALATSHAKLSNAYNVKILESSFDSIDLDDESVDVVISNGAINLTSCKESVFEEIYRVLKPKGKIFFADMIEIAETSCSSSENEDWANCVAGTMKENELIELIQQSGFKDVKCTGHTHYTTAETTQGATFKATKIPSVDKRESHWDGLFKRIDYTQVFWHQSLPQKSIDFIKEYASKDATIIDAGCGTSNLVDNLQNDGYKNITLLDTSKTALDIVKSRINTHNIEFIWSDILNFSTNKQFDIWHDRAVFHFLLNEKERIRYFEVLKNSLKNGGIAIISTFEVDGPIQCAGLDIIQYNTQKMLDIVEADFKILKSESYLHVTPKDTTQKYITFVMEKL